jgi:hypothetical protein
VTGCSRGILRAVLVLAAGTALMAGASPPSLAAAQTGSPLIDLSGSTDLQKQFNNDRGHVRLVLLLSPT